MQAYEQEPETASGERETPVAAPAQADDLADVRTVDDAARLISGEPGRADAVYAQLQASFGNAFVSQVASKVARSPGEVLAEQIEQLDNEALHTLLFSFVSVQGDQVMLQVGPVVVPIPIGERAFWIDFVKQRQVVVLVEKLQRDRAPLVEQMNGADGPAAQKVAKDALRAVDQPILDELKPLTQKQDDRWRLRVAPAATDALLAALQLEAVYRAEARADAPGGAAGEAQRACGLGGADDWCGAFVANCFMGTGLDPDLRAAFVHTEDLLAYFTYDFAFRGGERNPRWISMGSQWIDVQLYHAIRGQMRKWTDAQHIRDNDGLDIRPGDVVLVDHKGLDRPDHIAMVDAYDPATGRLQLVDGNGGGYVVDQRASHTPLPGEKEKEREQRERLEGGTGRKLVRGTGVTFSEMDLASQPSQEQVTEEIAKGVRTARVFGIGRPSIVDFEEHQYSKEKTMPVVAPRTP